MTKASVLFCWILLSACSSLRIEDRRTLLAFDSIKGVFANAPSQKQILKHYGKPDAKEKNGSGERWSYFDLATQFDRVQFVFDESKTLRQMFWLPLPDDKEIQIEPILARYPPGFFKPTNKRKTSNDGFGTETTYSDGSTMFILNDDGLKQVQMVAWGAPVPKSSSPMTSR
jgi:hypothetical protein